MSTAIEADSWRSEWTPAAGNSGEKHGDSGAMMPPSFYAGSFTQIEGAGSAWSEPVKSKYTPSAQAPPLMAPHEFQDASAAEAWQPKEHVVYDAHNEAKEPIKRTNTAGARRTPQRHIRLRSAGANLEEELRHQNLYKTEICRSWRETGACRYGAKCQFAHGEHELRPVLRHPKYKTEVCRNYEETGTCPYGSRCRFVHYQRHKSPVVDVKLSPEPSVPSKPKGSKLPFFQKLRRNVSGEKDSHK